MVSAQCESCGANNTRIVVDRLVHEYSVDGGRAAWNYALLRCNACGMGFISPKPSDDVLQTFYRSDYWCYDADATRPEDESTSLKFKIAQLRFASASGKGLGLAVATAFGSIIEWLSGRVVTYSLGMPLQLPKDARIFEVGYGSGNWLLSMKRLGYDSLHGYDIDANAENRSRLESAGIVVRSGNLLENDYADGYFDCIRLEHVFEHLLEPKAVLAELHRVLSPSGILVMTFPCISALSFSMSPRHCAHRDSPRHLYLHTPASARNILAGAGFTMLKMRLYAVSTCLGVTVNNMLKDRRIPLVIKGWSLAAPFYRMLGAITRQGEAISVMAVKQTP
jgi:SAM-dependent methyltransferase